MNADHWSVRHIISSPPPRRRYVLMSRSLDGVWSDRLYCDDREYALAICETLNSIEDTAAEIMRYRQLIFELLPFMRRDVKNGLSIGPPPAGHEADNCSDCEWYEQSLKWKKRIDAGEFAGLMYGDDDD